MKTKFICYLTFVFVFAVPLVFAQAQTMQISGTVTDEDGVPIPGVNITVEATSSGTSTDFDGNYSITAEEGQVLNFSSVGFQDQSISVGNESTINITMEEGTSLDEVVIVGYGTQKKITLTGSNVNVDSKKILDRPVSSVSNVLDGAGTGIIVAAGSGQPGDDSSIRIRGTGSLAVSNDPLIILDGVPYNGDLSNINPNDVESMDILKDASAVALYGSAAGNGVILITTKRGKANRMQVNFQAKTGFSRRFIPEYSRVGPKDYYELNWEAMRNGRIDLGDSEGDANTFASANLISNNLRNNVYNVPDDELIMDGKLNSNAALLYDDFDWQEPLLGTGVRQDYNASISGGDEKTTYYTSLGYTKDDGYVKKSGFERFSLRLNLDSQLKDWLKVGTSLTGTGTNTLNAVDGAESATSLVNPYRSTRRMGPIYSVYEHDQDTGERLRDEEGNLIFNDGEDRPVSPGRNVVQENLLNDDRTRRYEMNANIYGEVRIIPDLTFKTNIGYSVRNSLRKRYINNVIGDQKDVGTARRYHYSYQDFTINELLTYDKTIEDHHFTVLVGHENSFYDYNYVFAYKSGQTLDDMFEFPNFVDLKDNDATYNKRSKEGWFGRVNYDFLEKYIIDGSIRWDASSRFAKDVRWQSFWSFGAGWVISSEDFMNDSNIIDLLKLRGSYGEVGNDALENWYAYKSVFGLGMNNANEPGMVLDVMADPNITWETKAQMDLGLEFEVFDSRVRGTINYYNAKTKDMLFGVPTPLTSGIPDLEIQQNIGEMENKGWEFSLSGDIIRTQDVTWGIDWFGTAYKNRLTTMPPDQEEIIDGTKRLAKGRSIYDFWLKTYEGVDPNDGSALYLLDQEKHTDLSADDVREVDGEMVTTNQGKAKYEYHGSAIPDFYGSFGTNLRVKNWELNANFNYQMGGKIYDGNYMALMNVNPEGTALHTDVLDRWTEPGQITDVPKMDSQNTTDANAESSRWLVDASYVMLRSATIGYNFNQNLLEKIGMNSLKLYVSGENLWLSSKRKGLEPYQSFDGTTENRYSPTRILSFGINASF